MSFDEILALAKKGAGLLSEGRAVLDQVKDSIADSKAAISASEQSQLNAILDQEEQETKAAIASARDAIAEYRRG